MYPFGFAPYPDAQYDTLLEEFESVESFIGEHEMGPQIGFGSSQATQSTDREESTHDLRPPKRTDTQISRIVRNTSLVRDLKKRYGSRCQVCGEVRQRGASEEYAEGHHIHPLGHEPPGLERKRTS